MLNYVKENYYYTLILRNTWQKLLLFLLSTVKNHNQSGKGENASKLFSWDFEAALPH